MEDILCIGDIVCLFSAESYGFVFSTQTSTVHNEIAVAAKQDKKRPNFQDQQVFAFEVQTANRYKLHEKYIALKESSDKDPNNISLRNNVSKAKAAAESEKLDNESVQQRQQGKKVRYGMVIQLRHVFTNKYIHISTTNTSFTESNNMAVELKPENAIHAQFKIMPRYKVKAEGDVVQIDDQIVFESVRSSGSYLHVSRGHLDQKSVYAQCHEINLSVSQSGFTVYRKYKPVPEDEGRIKAGDVIRLFHREMEAYLVAEGIFNEEVIEDVHLKLRPMDQERPRTMLPSTSPVTYWQIELHDGPAQGGCLKWEQQCKIIHMCTRRYLSITKEGKVTLSNNHEDAYTVFRMHPVIRDSDFITEGSYCRIEHVVTGLWLHALHEEYQERRIRKSQNPNSITALGWSRAELKQIGTMNEKQYDDAFTIQGVEEELTQIFNYIAGMVPFIQKLVIDKKSGMILDARITQNVITALLEISAFMVENSMPVKDRQKLLRTLRVVDLMVAILRLPFRETRDQLHQTRIMVEAYDVLAAYLLGGSRKNELYIAKYINFFMSQIEYKEGMIGLHAAHMVMELIRDNRKIKDRITHGHIDRFVELLQNNKNYRYLDLLSVLCANDGVTIADNQTYITEIWLKGDNQNNGDAQKCVFHTSLGQEIGLEQDLVYVSTDQCKTWTELSEFAQDSQSEAYLFLVHQLLLFGELCSGQNEFCIKVITQELNYLTWEEAFVCLSNEDLPDNLRSQYCHLIVTMFVDIKDNHSVIDRIKLSYIYENVDEHMDILDLSHSQTYQYFPTLSKWMASFLARNSDMTASEIGSNMLIKQVLRLLQYLVSFGFYNKEADFKQLLGPLMNLVDGRHDNPYPNVPHGKEGEEILARYRTKERYQKSVETTNVVNAKCQALHTLNLFLNLRENFRMERFMNIFKITHTQAISREFPKAELAVCLQEDFDFTKHIKVAKTAVRRLKEIFDRTSFLKDFGLVDVLKDLSHYEYDEMIRMSMHLLNRNYSGLGKLYTRALQAQVLITDKSIAVCKKLETIMPVLKQAATTELNETLAVEVTGIIDQMIDMCHLEGEPNEEHPMNQSILYNHGILEDIFTLFNQKVDVKLMDKYVGLRKTFQKSFVLLKMMTRNNKLIQDRLCDRLDVFLSNEGAWEEMAECVTEFFTGNADTCMKITSNQIQKIMMLVAKHKEKIPQFLDLLNAIMKVEELDLPLKRNQSYVMQYFMQYRTDVAFVIDQDSSGRESILSNPDHKDLQYFICMVDMLATCAEGESRYIESICQTMFQVPDLLNILINPNIDENLKRPFLRFFQWVYLVTEGGKVDSGTGDLPHDEKMWQYLESVGKTVDEVTAYTKENPDSVQHLLKKEPSKADVGRTDEGNARNRLHYLFEDCMRFVQTFCRQYYEKEPELYPEEPKILDKLTKSFKDFLEVVMPLINIAAQRERLIACMTTLLPLSTFPNSYMKKFQEEYATSFDVLNIRSDAKKAYDAYYAEEERLNRELNTFASNMKLSYEGINMMEGNGGYGDDDVEELPSGQEFQEHLRCFIDPSKPIEKGRYTMAEKLIKQLIISAGLTQLSEKEREEQLELDIRCLQLLRGLIQMEIANLPPDWEKETTISVKKQLLVIEMVQNALDGYDVVTSVLEHLNKPQNEVVKEALACMTSLLYNGNGNIQASFIQYFYGTREEKFFFTIKKRMDMTASATTERRLLQAMHQAKLEEAKQQINSLNQAMENGTLSRMGTSMNLQSTTNLHANGSAFGSTNSLKPPMSNGGGATNLNGSVLSLSANRSTKVEPVKDKEQEKKKVVDEKEIELQVDTSEDDNFDFSDDEHTELLLRVLGLMCDNQCAEIQNYLREQPDNIKSANLVAEVTKFLNVVYTNINDKSMPLVVQLFDTLIEFTSGNVMNRTTVFDNKICDYINFILRVEHFQRCTQEDEYVLKKSIATLIKSLTEENPREDPNQDISTSISKSSERFNVKEVMQYLDTGLCVQTMTEAYKHMQKKDEILSLITDTGFAFYQVIRRKMDLDKSLEKTAIIKTFEQQTAWTYYEQSTLSIEILKDGVLQKVYFRVKDKKVLREEIKELFKYEVDRSSPSNKIRDFMDWASDIMQDIKYQRKVHDNAIGSFLVKMWIPMNYLVLALSIIICSFITYVWRDPKNDDGTSNTDSYKPDYIIDSKWYNMLLYSVGGVHNLLCFLILIAFFLSNRPSFPPYRYLMSKLKRRDKGHDLRAWHEKMDNSLLEVNIYSFKTVYYFILFGASVAGTLTYGYFFAFHLLHIAELNQLLKRVIKAVTTNGKSLILVVLLGLAVFFCYSLIAFAFFRETYLLEDEGRHCRTVGQCLISMIHHGVVDTPYTTFEGKMNVKYEDVIKITLFDVTFFILVTTVGLNIVFGIIVDTFSQLRDSKWEIDKDMQTHCFICSRESYDFERHGGGFMKHVKEEHNQWAYLFFFIHLDETRPNDYTGLELYVFNKLEENTFDFFPMNKALCLMIEEDSSEMRIEKMDLKLDFVMKTMKEEAATREREKDRLRQKEWEAKHRNSAKGKEIEVKEQ